ncbi:MAG: FmdE family protein, partial [Caldilineaceae bacterium]
MTTLTEFLKTSSALHRHLCPRQVLGARMGMLAGQLLSLDLPQPNKRLLTLVETDGCFADGVSVATNCWVGRRTLRVNDYGKIAATFVDTQTEQAIRIAPGPNIRTLAAQFAAQARNRWETQLFGYQAMPDELLFQVQTVTLLESAKKLISKPGQRVNCVQCGEEIINERWVTQEQKIYCKACAGQSYYQVAAEV